MREIKRIKKRNPGLSSNEALALVISKKEKNLKKLKFKNNLITAYIIANIIITIAVLIVVMSGIMQFIGLMANIAGLVSMDFFYEPKYDEEGNIIGDTWDWSDTWEDYWDNLFGDNGPDNGDYPDDISGGINGYPKDPVLKLKAQYIEIVDGAAKQLSVPVSGAWLMGVGSRESGGQIYRYNVNNADMYKHLTMLTSFCGQNSKCSWLNGGTSHVEGGSVSGGKDKGDPYNHKFNDNQSTYNSFGGNHAIGPYQFEIAYLYNSICRYKYGDSKEYSNPTMDKELGFMRPNPLYIPDAVICNAKLHELHWKSVLKNSKAIKSSDFKSLSEKNQNIVLFSLAGSMYGVGGWRDWMDSFATQLIKVGKTKDLDELLDADKYWDSGTMSIKMTGHAQTIHDFQAAGINWEYKDWNTGASDSQTHFPWSGLQAVNLGTIEYNKLVPIINAAEKDGELSGGIGSGVSGGLYLPVKPTDTFTPTITFQYGIFASAGTSMYSYGNAHQGTDIAGYGAKGQPIYTICDLKVKSANSDHRVKGGKAAGNNVIFTTTINGREIEVQYMHMISPPAISKKNESTGKVETVLLANMVGQTIPAGTIVGFIGNSGNTSGNASQGYHLHIEVRALTSDMQVKGTSEDAQTSAFKTSIPPLPALFGISSYNQVFSGYNKTDKLSYEKENKKVEWMGRTIYDLAVQ